MAGRGAVQAGPKHLISRPASHIFLAPPAREAAPGAAPRAVVVFGAGVGRRDRERGLPAPRYPFRS